MVPRLRETRPRDQEEIRSKFFGEHSAFFQKANAWKSALSSRKIYSPLKVLMQKDLLSSPKNVLFRDHLPLPIIHRTLTDTYCPLSRLVGKTVNVLGKRLREESELYPVLLHACSCCCSGAGGGSMPAPAVQCKRGERKRTYRRRRQLLPFFSQSLYM